MKDCLWAMTVEKGGYLSNSLVTRQKGRLTLPRSGQRRKKQNGREERRTLGQGKTTDTLQQTLQQPQGNTTHTMHICTFKPSTIAQKSVGIAPQCRPND
jgi:hypothetical protein